MKNKSILAIAASAAVLAGCGGGGDDSSFTPPAPAPTPAVSAEGIWAGKSSANRDITGIVLNDGTYYVMYTVVGVPTVLDGVIQGTGKINGASFASTDGRDFNFSTASVQGLSVSATPQTKQTLNGSLAYISPASTLTFTSAYSADYEKTPTLASITGRYTGQSALLGNVENQSITIAADGSLTATGASGCITTGKATPRASGNDYDLSITFGAAPCLFSTQTFKGVAYFDPASKRLYAASLNTGRTQIAVFLGTKQ